MLWQEALGSTQRVCTEPRFTFEVKMQELKDLYKEDPKVFWQEVGGALLMCVLFYLFTILMFCMESY